jgi:hypothetical protein
MDEIKYICEQYNITNYVINSDLSIDVDGDVNIMNMFLTEIPIRFNKVNGDFNCSYNNLTDLKNSPKYVNGFFNCSFNKIKSLENAPIIVSGHFFCIINCLIDNYCDTEIGGSFYSLLEQEQLIYKDLEVVNYKEWQKIIKRKKTLDELYTRHM